MTIQKVWSVWFSGTGTTETLVKLLADRLAEGLGARREDFSFNLPAARQQNLAFDRSDLVVAGVPVYAGRVPNLLLPWLQTGLQGNDTPAVPVVLFGNRDFDDGLTELHDTLAERGFCPLGAGAFVGQHAFSETLGAGRPDREDLALAEQLAQQVLTKIAAGERSPFPLEGCRPPRPYYVPRDRQGEPIRDFLKARPITTDQCVGCGLCADLCPMGSIDRRDFSVTGKCIKCNACIKHCPAGAKQFVHEGYLYHKQELEAQFGPRRAQSRIFF